MPFHFLRSLDRSRRNTCSRKGDYLFKKKKNPPLRHDKDDQQQNIPRRFLLTPSAWQALMTEMIGEPETDVAAMLCTARFVPTYVWWFLAERRSEKGGSVAYLTERA